MVASNKTPGNKFALFVSTVAFIICSQGLLTIMFIELPSQLAKAGHWQFLTNLSLAVSVVVFALNIIAQLTENIKIFHLKNELHAIAFTLESIVALVYWPLRLFFLNKIKISTGKMIPVALDLSIHLVPVIALSIDYYFCMPQWRITTSHAYIVCQVLGVAYWILLDTLIEEVTSYPYPFLQVETRPRMIIFAIVIHVAFANFYLQRKIHDLIIGKEIDDTYDKDK